MPRVRPYESQVSPEAGLPASGVGSVETGKGAEALGQSIVSGGYSGAHAYQIFQANADAEAVTKVHVALSELSNRATQQLADAKTKADPADPDFFNTVYRGGAPEGEDPREGSIQHQIDQLRAQVTNPVAQRAFDRGAAALTHQTLQQAVAFQGHLAGVYAKSQADTLSNNLETMVQTDPTQHANALALMNTAIDDPKGIFYRPGMDAGVREKIREMMTNKISKSMVQGMINEPTGAPLALHRLTRGDFDTVLTGEDKHALIANANTRINALEVEARRAEAEARRQEKARHDQTDQKFGAIFANNVANPGNPAFPPLKATQIADAMQNNELDGPTGRAWINMIEEHARRGPAKIPNNDLVERQLSKRIGLPDGDPKKIIDTGPIYKEYWDTKRIDEGAVERLTKQMVRSRSPEGSDFEKEKARFLNGMEPLILKPGPFQLYSDPGNAELYANFQRELDATIAAYHKAGKDPRVLFDPEAKEYMGKVAKSSKYQKMDMSPSVQHVEPYVSPLPGAPPRKSLDEIFGTKK